MKPDLTKHEGLFDAEKETGLPIRYAWAVLPCWCDRSGRFQWRPRRLTADILPYDENADMARVLDALLTRGFLVKYRVGNAWFGWIPTWDRHQVVNGRERKSDLPAPEDADELQYEGDHELGVAITTRASRVDNASSTRAVHAHEGKEGKGRERKGKEKEPNGSSPAAEEPQPEPRFRIPMTGGKEHPVYDEDLERYRELFPAVDVEQSIRAMLAWLDSNPKRRSGSVRGAKQRLTSWLTRDQDKASRRPAPGKTNGAGSDWNQVLTAASKGSSERQKFLDERDDLRDAINAAGGLRQIGLMNEWQAKEAKQKFMEAIQ